MRTNVHALVSPPAGPKTTDGAFSPAISADGRYVAYATRSALADGEYSSGGSSGVAGQVYVRDVQARTTRLVSRAAGARGAIGDGTSFTPAISADGRHVAFTSGAANLHPDDGDTRSDVLVRDMLGRVAAAPTKRPGCALTDAAIVGGRSGDRRTGTLLGDVIFGRGAGDVLRGVQGADCLYGGPGDDGLFGGLDRDRLFGGPGEDRLHGEAGDDLLFGDGGDDRLYGGARRDRLDGGGGADRLNGGSGADRLTDGRGRDRFDGGRGNDRIDARDRAARDRRRPDLVRCGLGLSDVAIADRADAVGDDCERVDRRRGG